MNLFLSITIPTYNRAEYLGNALDAVLAQVSNEPDVEVVISDNASTDTTQLVGQDYARRFPRVRYFRNASNVGFDGNVLACVERANGTYVGFFSDDDLPSPGFFMALLTRLRDSRPAILYVNHASFFFDDPSRLGKPLAPVHEWATQNGKEFYERYGLGFISALTVRADLARQYTSAVVMGRGEAHLDIVARVALSEQGLFVYDGRLIVFARYNDSCYNQILRYGFMGVASLNRDLHKEGRLSGRELTMLNRRMICGTLPRSILADRCQQKYALVRADELTELFGSDPLYYLLSYPLLVLPPSWIRAVALPLRAFVRYCRQRHYA